MQPIFARNFFCKDSVIALSLQKRYLQKTVETLINIFRNQGYIYKISKTEIENNDYHYNIGVCKYYGSEDFAVMYVKSGKNTHAPLELEDSLTDSLWIEDVRYTDIILKILYEYFQVFQDRKVKSVYRYPSRRRSPLYL